MDPHQRRIEEARARNLEYIRRLDEKETVRAAADFLREHIGGNAPPTEEPHKKTSHAASRSLKNTSVYVTGLTTYMACKQLEGMCGKIGKVRRIKFYKSETGGLKGDALVTFASHGMMVKAVERLNHFEIKPGVIITATEAQFNATTKSASANDMEAGASVAQEPSVEEMPARLFGAQVLHEASYQAKTVVEPSVSADEGRDQQGEQGEAHRDETATIAQSLPSRSVILKHVWDPLTPQDDATQFFTELEQDMKLECSKHGEVEHVHILPTGAVMVRYTQLPAAIQCLQVLNGRWFDGRQIAACFDPSTPDEPADDDTKLDAFFASLT